MIYLITFVSLATLVMFSQATYSVNEDDGPVQPVLDISKPSATDVTIRVTSTDGTAEGECCVVLINY